MGVRHAPAGLYAAAPTRRIDVTDQNNGPDAGRDPYAEVYGAHDPYAPDATWAADPHASPQAETRAYPTSDPYASADPYAAYANPYAGYADPYASYGSTATVAPPVAAAPKSGRGGMIALASAGLALTALVAGSIGGAVGFTVARMTQPEVAAVSVAPIGAT